MVPLPFTADPPHFATWAEVHVLQHDGELVGVQDEVTHALVAGLRTLCVRGSGRCCHSANAKTVTVSNPNTPSATHFTPGAKLFYSSPFIYLFLLYNCLSKTPNYWLDLSGQMIWACSAVFIPRVAVQWRQQFFDRLLHNLHQMTKCPTYSWVSTKAIVLS